MSDTGSKGGPARDGGPRRSLIASSLDRIERIGNALPDPMTLFAMGAVGVFLVSWIAAGQGWQSRLYDGEGELLLDVSARNLVSAEGFRWLFENLIQIFVGFKPLGLVLAAAIGIAVADRSGFITAGLKAVLVFVPAALLTPATFFTGVMSSMAVDAGFVVLPPLAAAVYKSVGRSPLVGIAVVTAGVASGFNANLFLTSLDPMLSGMTEEAARILDPEYAVNPACNWYFMVASTFVITLAGWAVAAWVVEPRQSRKGPEDGGPPAEVDGESFTLTAVEKSGLVWGLGTAILVTLFLIACAIFPWGFLYDEPGSIGTAENQKLFATWIGSIVPLLIVLFLFPGLAYGIRVGTIRSDRDVVRMMSEYLSLLGNYIVLAFFASIFVAAFERSDLGRMLAIEGGDLLRRADLPPWAMMLGFIGLVAFINLFIGSMSAKWAILATVFVPMFMTVGISPELTQVTYRVGDSVTNSVAPLNPYMPVILVFMQQHLKRAGLGTLISIMLPFALTLMVVWSLVLVVWIQTGQPLGPGGPLSYTP